MRLNLLIYFIRVLLWGLIAYLVCISLIIIHREPVWGIIDEIAHMDYIEKLSSGNYSFNTDAPIESQVFESFTYTRWAKTENFDGSMRSAGLAAKSYELHQPPAYYLLMTLPNLIMKQLNISLVQRVKTIRFFSWLIFLFSLWMGYVCMQYIIKKHNLLASDVTSQLYVLFLILVGSSNRYGVSNDWLPLFLVNTTLMLLALLYFEKQYNTIPWIHLLLAVLMLTKQTYVPLAIILFLAGIITEPKFRKWSLFYMIYIPVFLWYVIFIYQWNNYSISHSIFNSFFPSGMLDFKTFLIVLIQNAFDWNQLTSFSFSPGLWVFLLFIFSAVVMFIFNRLFLSIMFSMLVLIIVGLLMFVLNKWIGGVSWYAYRHYSGYGFFIFFAAFGWLMYVLHLIKLYIHRFIS